MRRRIAFTFAGAGFFLASLSLPAIAQDADPLEEERIAEAEQESEEEQRTGESGIVPQLDVYFPEGDLDLRVNRLIKKVFVEGQVQYNFVDGDISAFTRYRYYGYQRTYQFTVFDEVEFEDLEDFDNDFQRTRGVLLLTEWPFSYHHRAFLLTELDRISSNKEEFFFNNNRTNTFVRVGYQLGTPDDERSNAIVGENRARTERLFTALRNIGPGGAGATGAATWGFDFVGGDFDYIKVELGALKRFELPWETILVGRLNAGTFLRSPRVEFDRPDASLLDQFSIPRAEYFRLDGSDNLKGLKGDKIDIRGTEMLSTTWEYLFPWFTHQKRKALKLTWENWYWVLYAGYGTIGFDRDIYGELSDYVTDVGVGFESSFTLKDYEFFLSGIVARPIDTDRSPVVSLSLKSYH